MSSVVVLVSPLAIGGPRASFALERLGLSALHLPTALDGRTPGQRQPVADAAFAALAADLPRASVGAVVLGRSASPAQAAATAGLVAAIKAESPAALIVAEWPDDQRDLAGVDVAVIGLKRLAALSGQPLDDPTALGAAARALGPARVVVTAAPALMSGKTATALVGSTDILLAEVTNHTDAPAAPGDLVGALFAARLLAGADDEKALMLTAATLFEIAARSRAAGSAELDLPAQQAAIIRPTAMVDMRRLGGVRRRAVARPTPLAGL